MDYMPATGPWRTGRFDTTAPCILAAWRVFRTDVSNSYELLYRDGSLYCTFEGNPALPMHYTHWCEILPPTEDSDA